MTDVTALLAGIKERAEKATEGPWVIDRNTPFNSDLIGIYGTVAKQYIVLVDEDDPTTDADAAFIAAARMDIPRLVSAIEGVAQIHRPNGGHNPECLCGIEPGFDERCSKCGDEWPCPTITAVVAALGEDK